MKKVVLIFPDTTSIANFILKERVSNSEVNSNEYTLIGVLTDRQIVTAETFYGCIFKKPHL